MKRTLISSASALAILAGAVAVPTSAFAYPIWVIPAIIGAAVGGIGIGAVAEAQSHPVPPAYVADPLRPRTEVGFCRMARVRVDGVWRRAEVCD